MASSGGSRALFSSNGDDECQPLLDSDNGEGGSGNAGSALSLQHILVDYIATETLIDAKRTKIYTNAKLAAKKRKIEKDGLGNAVPELDQNELAELDADLQLDRLTNGGFRNRTRIKANPRNKAKIDQVVNEVMQSNAGVAKSARLFGGQQNTVAEEVKKPSGVEGFFLYVFGSMVDFIITFFRSGWMVLTDVLANGSNVSNDRPDTHFNKTVYNDGNAASGLSIVGAVVLGLMGVPVLIALGIAIYQAWAKQYRVSADNLAEHEDEKDVPALVKRLSERTQKALEKNRLTMESFLKPSDQWSDDHQPSALTQAVRAFFNSKPMTVLNSIWGRLSSLSYIFWLVWFPFAYKFGLTAASSMVLTPGGFFVVPIVLAITFTLGAVMNLVDVIIRLKSENPKEPLTLSNIWKRFTEEPKKSKLDKVNSVVDAELQQLEHSAKLLEFIKNDHLKIRKSFNVDKKDIMAKLGFAKRKPKDYQNVSYDPNLRNRLLGSSAQRVGHLIVAGAREFIGGALTLIFITWLGSTVVDFFGFSTAASLIGDNGINGVAGIGMGIFTAWSTVASLREHQLGYARRVDAVLISNYRGTDESKEHAFQRLYSQVEHRKKLLMDAVQAGKISNAQMQEYLDKIDVFNDHLFENFEYEETKSSKARGFFEKVYVLLFNAQTGAFLTRFFFLTGGLFAGAKIGGLVAGFSVFAIGSAAFWPFVIVALTLMVGVAVLALTRSLLQDKQEHRENFVNTLDARLYYLEKKNSELCELQYIHKVDAGNAFEQDESTVAPEVVVPHIEPADPLRESSGVNAPHEESGSGNSGSLVVDDEQDAADTMSVTVTIDEFVKHASVKDVPALKDAPGFFSQTRMLVRPEMLIDDSLTRSSAPAA